MSDMEFNLAYISNDGEVHNIGNIANVTECIGASAIDEDGHQMFSIGCNTLTFEVNVTPQIRRKIAWLAKHGRMPWTYAERKRRCFRRKG